jgi:hypothetical protein
VNRVADAIAVDFPRVAVSTAAYQVTTIFAVYYWYAAGHQYTVNNVRAHLVVVWEGLDVVVVVA